MGKSGCSLKGRLDLEWQGTGSGHQFAISKLLQFPASPSFSSTLVQDQWHWHIAACFLDQARSQATASVSDSLSHWQIQGWCYRLDSFLQLQSKCRLQWWLQLMQTANASWPQQPLQQPVPPLPQQQQPPIKRLESNIAQKCQLLYKRMWASVSSSCQWGRLLVLITEIHLDSESLTLCSLKLGFLPGISSSRPIRFRLFSYSAFTQARMYSIFACRGENLHCLPSCKLILLPWQYSS